MGWMRRFGILCASAAIRSGTAILDKFLLAQVQRSAESRGGVVKACQACYDGAMAYGTPFVSGKDSLSNEFITQDGKRIQIPYTLLISAMSMVEDVRACVTMDVKRVGSHLVLVGATKRELGGSQYYALRGEIGCSVPSVDLKLGPATAKAVAAAIKGGLVLSAHDLSEGGLAVALAEMLFAGNLGAKIDLAGVVWKDASPMDDVAVLFAGIGLALFAGNCSAKFDTLARQLTAAGIPFGVIGRTEPTGTLSIKSLSGGSCMQEELAALKKSWRGTLDW